MNHYLNYSVVCFSRFYFDTCPAPQLAAWDPEPLQGHGGVAGPRERGHPHHPLQGTALICRLLYVPRGPSPELSQGFSIWFVALRIPPRKSLKTRTGRWSLKMWVHHTPACRKTLRSIVNLFGRPLAVIVFINVLINRLCLWLDESNVSGFKK